jgi:hypothetical protein
MYNSKLIRLFKQLDKKEVRDFEKYLHAFYEKKKVSLSLFDHIKSHYPELDSPKLKKAYVAAHIFQDEKAEEKRIANELHHLLYWLEEFLAWRQINKKEGLKNQTLLSVYKEKQLDDFFYAKIEKLQKKLPQQEMSIDKFLQLTQLEHYQYYYTPTHKINKKDQSIEKAIQYLDQYHQLLGLKYQCELKSRENILQADQSEKVEKPIPATQKKLEAEYHFLYQMLSELHQLINKPSDPTFRLLKDILKAPAIKKVEEKYEQEVKKSEEIHIVNLNDEDQNLLLSYLVNYTIRLNNEGKAKGTKEAFDIYQKGIENRMVLTDGYISEPKFLNIVNTACELKEYNWAKTFVEQFKDHLPREWKDDIITITLARIAFGEKNFEYTLDLLPDARFRDHTHTIHAKLLQLRCYYELEEKYELTFADLRKSFKLFLSRNKTLSKALISGCKNFMTILEMLVSRHKEKETILEKINGYRLLVCKSWLQAKLEDYPD